MFEGGLGSEGWTRVTEVVGGVETGPHAREE